MRVVQAVLSSHGPLIQVLAGVSLPHARALAQCNIPRPAEVITWALLDTGSDCVVVDHSAITQLGLLPTGATSIHTASTGGISHFGETYDLSLWVAGIPPILLRSTTEGIASNLSGFSYHLIIGRSILDRCCLVYDGRRKNCALDFDIQSP